MKNSEYDRFIDFNLSSASSDQQKKWSKASANKRLSLLSEICNIPEDILLERVAQAAEMKCLHRPKLLDEPTSVIPARLIFEFQTLPLAEQKGDFIALTTLWPPTKQMDDWIYALCRKPPIWHLSDPEWLANTINKRFGVGSGTLEDTDFLEEGVEEEEEDENTAIIRFVNDVFSQAIRDRATDIHVEPRRDLLNIRYRIDGQLVPVMVPENLIRFQSAIISRVKIMARLNISEKRKPQDGRITFSNRGDEIDIRVSTLPTMYGESVSMRLLNENNQPVTIPDLGILEDDQKKIDQVLALPHGILLITGPTGSGKSTTLSAFMRHIAAPEKRIITVEDPIEYEIPEVNQTQVQSEIGLTFASVLRSVLRQDPDILMIGEIRDRETADIAIRASLTGHLVLSTLHTNDSPGALTRLIDMEIEPFLIASSVEMIIAQRLVRRLCPKCSNPSNMSPREFESCMKMIGLKNYDPKEISLVSSAGGCEHCSELGFRGRVGIFEVLQVGDSLHEMIVNQASAKDIRVNAVEHGMRSLIECGWEQVKLSRTTLSEIVKFADITHT